MLKSGTRLVDVEGMSPPDHQEDEAGFTLIELIVVMSIVGILAAIATFGFSNQVYKSQQQGSTQQIVSILRALSGQAISEGRTYCVALDNGAVPATNRDYTTWRYSCGGATGVQTGPTKSTQSDRVSFTATSTLRAGYACPASKVCIYFYPRGTADPANLIVRSTKRTKTYSISVQGLTARVY